MKKNVFILAIAALLIVATNAQTVNQSAPDFTVATLNSGNFKLSEQNGKVVLVFAFGYNCTFCKSSASDVNSLIGEYSGNSDFVAISIDTWNGSNSQVQGFVNSTGINGIVGLNAGGVASAYGSTYDRLWVIDKDMVLVHKGTSQAGNDANNAKAAIEQALQDPSAIGNNVQPQLALNVYPNPVTNNLTLSINAEKAYRVKIVDMTGKEVFASLFADKLNVDTDDFAPGMYFAVVETEGETIYQRFIKQ